MPEWVNEVEVPADNREAFNSAMDKYETKDAALMGGFNAMQMTGQPFRMPKDMDSLPDDTARDDFRSQAYKLLGVQHAASVDDLKALDLKAGGAESVDENLANTFKQFVVDKKMPIGVAQETIGFVNQLSAQFKKDAAAKAVTDAETAETEGLEKMKAVNAELVTMLGSQDEVDKQSKLFKLGIKNGFGLDADGADEVVDAMVDAGLTKNSKLASIMLKAIAPFGAEGGTENGQGGNPPKGGPTVKEQLPQTGKALGW